MRTWATLGLLAFLVWETLREWWEGMKDALGKNTPGALVFV